MIKALLLLSTLAFAGDFQVSVSCEKLPEYIAVCETNVTLEPIEVIEELPIYEMTHNIVWGYGADNTKPFVGEVQIRYENPMIESFSTHTNEAGVFTAVIIEDEAFFVYAYDFIEERWSTHDVKFILRIGSTTGNLLWKKWKPSTSRWIKLDLNSGIILNPNNVIDDNATSEINVTHIIYDMGDIQ